MNYLLPALLLLVACAHNPSTSDLTAMNETQGVSVSVKELKVKENTVTFKATIKNSYPFTIVIPERSLTVAMNGTDGEMRSPNPRWTLKTNQTRDHRMEFSFSETITSEMLLALNGIAKGVESIAVGGKRKIQNKTILPGIDLPPVKLVLPYRPKVFTLLR